MSATLTFDESAAEFVLESFDKEVDAEGYVIDPDTEHRETTPDGEEIHVSEFAGLEEGSILFLDDDFTTLVDHIKRRREK